MMIFFQLFIVFIQIGIFGFGGGYSMIYLIQGQVVTQYHWMTMQEFTDVVAISQMTPGPIGINTATYCGYTAVHNAGMSGMMAVLGSAMATFALVLPSLVLMILISKILYKYMNTSAVQSIFIGLRPAIVGLVGAAALLLMNGENFSTPANPWHFYISIALFELLYASQSLEFLHLHRPLLCHLYRREGDEDQSYPHDTLLGFCRTGITILNKIFRFYLVVIYKNRTFSTKRR